MMEKNPNKKFKKTKVHDGKFSFPNKIQVHQKIGDIFHEFNEFQFGWLPCTNVMSGPSDTDGCY